MAQIPRVIDPDGLASGFIDEWLSDAPTVTAHTSGSTGTPKELQLLKSDMLRSAEATCRYFGIDRMSVLHLPLSTSYIAGKMMVVRAMVSGATLIVERASSTPLLHIPSEITHVDLTAVVPSQVNGLLASSHIGKLRNVIVGGGAVSAEIEQRLRQSPVHAWTTYGMTETCSHVALRDLCADADTYAALPGVVFSTDDRGCLVIEAESYSFGHLVTNDVVELVSAHEFRWLGRYDNVINSGGIKLHPEEMEKRLEGLLPCPFYIIGRPSARWGEEAVIVAEGADPAMCMRIMDIARGVFDRYRVPKDVINMTRFIYASNGKIKRVLP